MEKFKIIIQSQPESAKRVVLEVLKKHFAVKETSDGLLCISENCEVEILFRIRGSLTEKDFLILNSDEEKQIETPAKVLRFGFSETADFKISDVNGGENETNFKLNYKGKSVPIWISRKLDLQGVYGVLSAFCVGDILGLNVIEMSENLKNI